MYTNVIRFIHSWNNLNKLLPWICCYIWISLICQTTLRNKSGVPWISRHFFWVSEKIATPKATRISIYIRILKNTIQEYCRFTIKCKITFKDSLILFWNKLVWSYSDVFITNCFNILNFPSICFTRFVIKVWIN